jgi:type II secretory pathway pseudopilin PulG
MMVVVALVGVLASVAIPQYQEYVNRARASEAKTELATIYARQHAFASEWSGFTTCLRTGLGYAPEGYTTATRFRGFFQVGFGSEMPGTTPSGGPSCTAGEGETFFTGDMYASTRLPLTDRLLASLSSLTVGTANAGTACKDDPTTPFDECALVCFDDPATPLFDECASGCKGTSPPSGGLLVTGSYQSQCWSACYLCSKSDPFCSTKCSCNDDGCRPDPTQETQFSCYTCDASEPWCQTTCDCADGSCKPKGDPDPTDPTDPNTGDPNTGDPNTGDPNTGDPSTDDPSTDDPSTDDPSTDDPSTDDPNTGDPNVIQSGGSSFLPFSLFQIQALPSRALGVNNFWTIDQDQRLVERTSTSSTGTSQQQAPGDTAVSTGNE